VGTIIIGPGKPPHGIGFIRGPLDPKRRSRQRERAQIVLGTDLDLTTDERRENLILVDRSRRGDLARAQALQACSRLCRA